MNFLQVRDQDMCQMYNTTVIPHTFSSSHLTIIILILAVWFLVLSNQRLDL